MCGIAGIFNYVTRAPVDQAVLERMCHAIAHRGPDSEGFYHAPECGLGLGHRRLSIIDLSTGFQPMSNAAEDVWIVFNGEIYNCWDLKKDLEARGHSFRTKSDTEVIIKLYEEYGESEFHRLNGIFAFAIFDKRKHCLVLARDQFGIKPLYYSMQNGRLVFSSEIKAILEDPQVPASTLDMEAFNSFLTFRYNPSPQTLFNNIRKLSPGHFLKITLPAAIELQSFWDYRPRTNLDISEAEAVEEYRRLLDRAVDRQMLADVPVGLLLSGGVDSAVIGYLMQRHSATPIKTFTIGFGGKGDYNELEDARTSARFIGSDHYEMSLSREEYLDFFFKSFYYTEEPIAETTIPALFYVSKLAASHLKVVLAGQGADEPLAGYRRYYGERQLTRYAPLLRFLPVRGIAKLLPRNERFKRAAYASQFTDELQRFLAIYTIFTPQQKNELLQPEIRQNMRNVDVEILQRLYDKAAGLSDSLAKILFIDARKLLSDDLLLFNDKMSMANSLEMRVPFLDLEFIQFVESLPSHMKLRGRTHKYIHKMAVRKWLPREIIDRKKRGFATPMDEWLQKDFAAEAKRILNERDSACRQFFNLDFINTMIDKHQQRKENFEKHIFTLLCFEVWYKTFFERKRVPSIHTSIRSGCE